MISPYFNNARQFGAGVGISGGVGAGTGVGGSAGSAITWSSGQETLHAIHQTYGPMYVIHPHVIYPHVIHPIGFSTFPFGSTYYL